MLYRRSKFEVDILINLFISVTSAQLNEFENIPICTIHITIITYKLIQFICYDLVEHCANLRNIKFFCASILNHFRRFFIQSMIHKVT